MAKDPGDDEVEVEVICPRCDYRLTRSVARLRRDTPLVCPNCGYRLTNEAGQPPIGGR
jgi:DNA-directed RNA polymerase subunit RPC12/RpoP